MINTTPKELKQGSGVVVIDSRFAVTVAHQYGVTDRERSSAGE